MFLDTKDVDSEPLQFRDHIFISYSHNDSKWLAKLQTALKPLAREGKIKLWADTCIEAGDKWREEINKALAVAKVAILLVTQDFLASDFIAQHELWIAVSSSMYKETEIEQYQAANNPSKPLDGLSTAKQNQELVRIGEKIKAAMAR